MERPQFTIRYWMGAVAILAIMLAMPDLTLRVGEVLLFLAVPALVISQLPYRVRLTVETSFLLILLGLIAWGRQSRFYKAYADHAARLGHHALACAAESKDPKARATLRREAAWCSRRAVALRVRAVWEGLIHGPTFSAPLSRRDHRRLLDVMWEIKRHEDRVSQASGSSLDGGPWP